MKAILSSALAIAIILIGVGASWATDWFEYDLNIIGKPLLAGALSTRYDEPTGKFLALYTKPGLWLSRCDQNGCDEELVDPTLDVAPRAFMLRDDDGLLALYSVGESLAPRLAREGAPNWTTQDLTLPLDAPIIHAAAVDPNGEPGLLVSDIDDVQYYCRSEKYDNWQCEPRTFLEGGQSLAYDSQGLAHVLDLQIVDDDWLLVHVLRNAAGEWEEETVAPIALGISEGFLAVNAHDEVFVYYSGIGAESFVIYGYTRDMTAPNWHRVTLLTVALDYFYSREMGNLAFDAVGDPVYIYSYSGEDAFFPDWPPPVYSSWLCVGGSSPWTVFHWSFQGSLYMPVPEYSGYIQIDEMNKPHLLAQNENYGYKDLIYQFDRAPASYEETLCRTMSIEYWMTMSLAALPADGGLTPYLFANRRYSESWSTTDVFTYAPANWKIKWPIVDDQLFYPGRDAPMIVSPEGLHFIWSQYDSDSEMVWQLATYHDGQLTREPLVSYPEQFLLGQAAMHSAGDLLIAVSDASCGGVHFARRPPGGPVGEFVELGVNSWSPSITACSDGLARIVYLDSAVNDLILLTEGEPFSLETIVESVNLFGDYGLKIVCDETDVLQVFYSTFNGIFTATDTGDAWTSERLWSDATLGDVVLDEQGRVTVGFVEESDTVKLAHQTDTGWEVETLAENSDLPIALWSDNQDFVACYRQNNRYNQGFIQCRSTAPFVEDEYPIDDDTVDDDTTDDDTTDDDTVDDDTVDDDTTDDDTIDDDTTDDDTIDDDTTDDDVVDDDVVDDDVVDDDVTDDDATDDDTTPGVDDDDDNDDGCGKN
ncbi:MAG TPA: hypothetical protein PKW95_08965 [bacterium]|nr:hypothetical protein [bacterium]